LFIPGQSGQVAAGVGNTIIINVSVSAPGGTLPRKSQQAVGEEAARGVERALRRAGNNQR
jgi:hypothetical protein